jgi:hypothetical protein
MLRHLHAPLLVAPGRHGQRGRAAGLLDADRTEAVRGTSAPGCGTTWEPGSTLLLFTDGPVVRRRSASASRSWLALLAAPARDLDTRL